LSYRFPFLFLFPPLSTSILQEAKPPEEERQNTSIPPTPHEQNQ